MLWAERQSARMSKITNDNLMQSGTECSIAVPIWQATVSVKGLKCEVLTRQSHFE